MLYFHYYETSAISHQQEVAPLAGMSLRNTNNILHTSYAKFLFRNNLLSSYVIR
ncbi:MAG: hypothetical protein V1749_08600 [Candidatus Desantisbacteria bacterium]